MTELFFLLWIDCKWHYFIRDIGLTNQGIGLFHIPVHSLSYHKWIPEWNLPYIVINFVILSSTNNYYNTTFLTVLRSWSLLLITLSPAQGWLLSLHRAMSSIKQLNLLQSSPHNHHNLECTSNTPDETHLVNVYIFLICSGLISLTLLKAVFMFVIAPE